MPEWKREIREALAGAKLETDAAREEAVVEELEQDLVERYEELVRNGAAEQDARRMLSEELRDARFLAGLRPRLERRQEPAVSGLGRQERFLAGLSRDVRLGARLLRKNPVVELVSVLSITRGIGESTEFVEL